jgi:NAD(P)-dependent dehydrogenase (short-subunit alcohol dehydrogenase family)
MGGDMTEATGTVLITGALGGMASATLRELATRYPHLTLTDRDSGRLKVVADEIEALGAKCEVVACDLALPESIAELVAVVGGQGGLRALVHTAAVSPSMADWRMVITVDLVGTVRLLDGLLPLALPGAAAICIASIAAHMGRPISEQALAALADPGNDELIDRLAAAAESEPTSGMAYIWAKTAIVSMCERLAGPWGRRGARIVSLSPGLMDTPMGRFELAENAAKQPLITVTPLRGEPAGRRSDLPGRTSDIASAIAFLLSEEASFINGCDLRVDGGFIGAWRYEPR